MMQSINSAMLAERLRAFIDAKDEIKRQTLSGGNGSSDLAKLAERGGRTHRSTSLIDALITGTTKGHTVPDLRPLRPLTFVFSEMNVRNELEHEFGAFCISPENAAVSYILNAYRACTEPLSAVQSILAGTRGNYADTEYPVHAPPKDPPVVSAILTFPYLVYCLHESQNLVFTDRKSIRPVLHDLVSAGQPVFLRQLRPQLRALHAEIESARFIDQFEFLKCVRDLETFRLFFPDIGLRIYEKENGTLQYKPFEITQHFLWDGVQFADDLPRRIMCLLRFYAGRGRSEIVRHIADTTKLSGKNVWSSLLYIAAKRGHASIVEMALMRGGDLRPASEARTELSSLKEAWEHALAPAIRRKHVDVIKTILRAPTYSNEIFRNFEKADPFIEGVHTGDIKVVEAFLDAGCDPNTAYDRESCLTSAVVRRSRDIVRLLLEHGADPNLNPMDFSFFPIHIAAFSTDCDIARLLLEAGADPNVLDNMGHTPLTKAYLKRDLALCALLLRNGAENTQNREARIVVVASPEEEDFAAAYTRLLNELGA